MLNRVLVRMLLSCEDHCVCVNSLAKSLVKATFEELVCYSNNTSVANFAKAVADLIVYVAVYAPVDAPTYALVYALEVASETCLVLTSS